MVLPAPPVVPCTAAHQTRAVASPGRAPLYNPCGGTRGLIVPLRHGEVLQPVWDSYTTAQRVPPLPDPLPPRAPQASTKIPAIREKLFLGTFCACEVRVPPTPGGVRVGLPQPLTMPWPSPAQSWEPRWVRIRPAKMLSPAGPCSAKPGAQLGQDKTLTTSVLCRAGSLAGSGHDLQ